MTTPLASAKDLLRKQMREKLRTVSAQSREQSSQALMRILDVHPHAETSGCTMVYLAKSDEVSLDALILHALAAHKKVAAPRVERNDILPHLIQNLDEDLEKNMWGIREPRASCPRVSLKDIGLVIVPGLAFDWTGRRLGRGEGFYDRFLKQLPGGVHTVGVCFELQIVREVPAGPGDMGVTEVISI